MGSLQIWLQFSDQLDNFLAVQYNQQNQITLHIDMLWLLLLLLLLLLLYLLLLLWMCTYVKNWSDCVMLLELWPGHSSLIWDQIWGVWCEDASSSSASSLHQPSVTSPCVCNRSHKVKRWAPEAPELYRGVWVEVTGNARIYCCQGEQLTFSVGRVCESAASTLSL